MHGKVAAGMLAEPILFNDDAKRLEGVAFVSDDDEWAKVIEGVYTGFSQGGRYVKRATAHDHWHKTTDDPGRPYEFTTASRLLDDFWREVKRALDEKGIPNDL